jgi:hypothetical protein
VLRKKRKQFLSRMHIKDDASFHHLPSTMNDARARAPTWCAFFLDEQRWTHTQLTWFMVFVGNMVQEQLSPTLMFLSFALFGRGPESHDMAERVCRLLFPPSPMAVWVQTSSEHAFALWDALYHENKPPCLPPQVILQGYQRRTHNEGVAYNQLLRREVVTMPARQCPWRCHRYWGCKFVSVVSDASSDTAVPDLDYFQHTALFLLGSNRDKSTLSVGASSEVPAFLALCTDTSKKVLAVHRPEICSYLKLSDLPWSIGPLQFTFERILSSTPLLPDIVQSILMPYLDVCVG